jgi:Tol biopolymer transport system component
MSGRSGEERQQLWIRTLDEPEIRVLPGTEGAEYPFWSPDGTSVAFFAEGALKKVDIVNGTVQRICAVSNRYSAAGTWNSSGDIVFEFGPYTTTLLYSVKAAGGEAMPFTAHDTSRGETAHWVPQFLPDGNHILFVVISDEEGKTGLHVTEFEDPSRRRQVLSDLTRFIYAEPGYLLFTRDGVLLAQRFDTEHLEVKGEPITIVSGVAESAFDPDWGRFSVSATGVVTWLSARAELQLEWIDRSGETLGTLGEPGDYGQVALSPDETRLAVEIRDISGRYDLWIMNVARGVASRVTDDPGDERDPVWSPDGQELVFANFSGGGDLMRKQLSAGGSASTLLGDSGPYISEFWTRDGNTLLFVTAGEERFLSALSLDGDESVERLTEDRPDFDEPQVSPDGRWLASVSTESGQWEVYVEPFRRRGERVRVSNSGGGQPKWRGDGRELFYLTLGGALAAVEVGEGVQGPEVGAPTTLISADVLRAVVAGQDTDDYAVSADGQRFLVKRQATLNGKQQIHVLLNWPSLVEKNGDER